MKDTRFINSRYIWFSLCQSIIGRCRFGILKRYLGVSEPKQYWIILYVLFTQLCPTVYNPMDCSRSGSSVHGILQVRIWSGLPFLSPGYLPNPGIKSGSAELQTDSLPSKPPGKLNSVIDPSLSIFIFHSL